MQLLVLIPTSDLFIVKRRKVNQRGARYKGLWHRLLDFILRLHQIRPIGWLLWCFLMTTMAVVINLAV